MNAKVYKHKKTFKVAYHLNGEQKVFYSKTEKDALDKSYELNFKYYSENRNQLPRGITLDLDNNRFRFHIRLNGKKPKHIKSSRYLDELIEIRKHVIKNLLDLF